MRKAAVKIQCAWRCCRARRQLAALKEKKRIEEARRREEERRREEARKAELARLEKEARENAAREEVWLQLSHFIFKDLKSLWAG